MVVVFSLCFTQLFLWGQRACTQKNDPRSFVPYTFAFVHLARCGCCEGEYIEMIDDCLWSEFRGRSFEPYHIVYLIFPHNHSKVRRGLQSRPSPFTKRLVYLNWRGIGSNKMPKKIKIYTSVCCARFRTQCLRIFRHGQS